MNPSEVKRYRYLRAKGYRVLVDAGPARAHLMYLHVDLEMTFVSIAQGSGVKIGVVTGLHQQRAGRYQKMRVADSVALLAFSARPLTRAERMRGTTRILKGLSAAGVSTSVVTEYMHPYRRQTLDNWRMGHPGYVPSCEVYNELVRVGQKIELMTPAELGMTTHVYNQVKARSKTYGYAPISAWDWETIHNADAYPEWTGACGTQTGVNLHRTLGTSERYCVPCSEFRRVRRAEMKAEKGAAYHG